MLCLFRKALPACFFETCAKYSSHFFGSNWTSWCTFTHVLIIEIHVVEISPRLKTQLWQIIEFLYIFFQSKTQINTSEVSYLVYLQLHKFLKIFLISKNCSHWHGHFKKCDISMIWNLAQMQKSALKKLLRNKEFLTLEKQIHRLLYTDRVKPDTTLLK